jgi:hypothetical protein
MPKESLQLQAIDALRAIYLPNPQKIKRKKKAETIAKPMIDTRLIQNGKILRPKPDTITHQMCTPTTVEPPQWPITPSEEKRFRYMFNQAHGDYKTLEIAKMMNKLSTFRQKIHLK